MTGRGFFFFNSAEGHQDLKQPVDAVPKTQPAGEATWAVVRGAYMLDVVVSGTHFTCFTGTKGHILTAALETSS
jgi:hypothetical protein